jgi:hypothetical protein
MGLGLTGCAGNLVPPSVSVMEKDSDGITFGVINRPLLSFYPEQASVVGHINNVPLEDIAATHCKEFGKTAEKSFMVWYPDGTFYSGDVNKEYYNCLWFDTDGNEYFGDLQNGKPHGKGRMYTKGSNPHEYYYGDWKEGMKEGSGWMRYADGGFYRGEWVADKWHGEGRFWEKGEAREPLKPIQFWAHGKEDFNRALAPFKKECVAIGYKPDTEKFADCVMQLRARVGDEWNRQAHQGEVERQQVEAERLRKQQQAEADQRRADQALRDQAARVARCWGNNHRDPDCSGYQKPPETFIILD